jgi:hypothetical protein
MASLRWRKPDETIVRSGENVRSGSRLHIQGRFYDAANIPEHFFLYRLYGRLATRYLHARKLPVEKQLLPLDSIRDQQVPTSAISENFMVPTVGMRLSMPIFMRDSLGNESQAVDASRLGKLIIGPNVTILGTGGGVGQGELTVSVDPEISLSLLLPWKSEKDFRLEPLIDEIAEDLNSILDGPQDATREGMRELISWAMPDYPPDGWEIDLTTRSFSLWAGETVSFGIHLITPTPGIAAFAVQAEAQTGDEESRDSVVSELMVVEADDTGTPTLSTI